MLALLDLRVFAFVEVEVGASYLAVVEAVVRVVEGELACWVGRVVVGLVGLGLLEPFWRDVR